MKVGQKSPQPSPALLTIPSPSPFSLPSSRPGMSKASGKKDTKNNLPVALGNTLELVLLLDGVRVGGTLGSVDQLISEALSNGLDVAESGLASTSGEEVDGLVDPAEGGDIDGLATDGTSRANTGGVLTGTGVDNGVDEDLDGVLVGEEVDDLKGVLDNADSHELLAVVTAVHHHGVGEPLNNGALGLAETLDGKATSGVGQVDGGANLDVVLEGDILDLNVLEGPLVEQADTLSISGNLDGKSHVDYGRGGQRKGGGRDE